MGAGVRVRGLVGIGGMVVREGESLSDEIPKYENNFWAGSFTFVNPSKKQG